MTYRWHYRGIILSLVALVLIPLALALDSWPIMGLAVAIGLAGEVCWFAVCAGIE